MGNTISVDLDFNNLNCFTETPDVTLIIGETEVPAHRAILSERCEYFKTMFSSSFIEAKSDKIILKETNLLAFKVILKFIYTGRLSTLYHQCDVATCKLGTHNLVNLKELFEIFACAQYYMIDDLVKDTVAKLRLKCISRNHSLILNDAVAYSVDELITQSTELIQKEARHLIEKKVFEPLTPMALEHVLKCGFETYESNVFEALVLWMRNNPDYAEAFPRLLEHIELNLVDKAHLKMLFEPTQLISPLFLENLISQQRQQAQNVQKLVDQDVINGVDDLRIIDGGKYVIGDETNITPLNPTGDIVFDLKHSFLLNHLKIVLKPTISYTISMSTDLQNWDLVIDRSKYECSGPQTLYFTERVVRFIKIQSNAKFVALTTDIQACYSTKASSIEIDPPTTLIVPKRNLIPSVMVTKYLSASDNIVGGWMTGKIINGYIEMKNTSSLVYEFRQPYIIGSLKLLFKEETSYYVEVAYSYRQKWTRVNSEENVSGWRIATFEKQPVVFIKIVGTKDPDVLEYFHLYGIECPAI